MAFLPMYFIFSIFIICLTFILVYRLRRKNFSLILLSILGLFLTALKISSPYYTTWVMVLVIGFIIIFVLSLIGLKLFENSK